MVDEDGNPVELDDVEKEGDGELGDEGVLENRLEKMEDVDEDIKVELEETHIESTAVEQPKGKGKGTPKPRKPRAKKGQTGEEEVVTPATVKAVETALTEDAQMGGDEKIDGEAREEETEKKPVVKGRGRGKKVKVEV